MSDADRTPTTRFRRWLPPLVALLTVGGLVLGLERSGVTHPLAYVFGLAVVVAAFAASLRTHGRLGVSSRRIVESLWLAVLASTAVSLIALIAGAGDLSEGFVVPTGPAGSFAVLVGVFTLNQLATPRSQGRSGF